MAAPFKKRTAATFRRDITWFTRLRHALQLNHVIQGEGESTEDAEAAIELIDKLTPILIRLARRAALSEQSEEDDGIAA